MIDETTFIRNPYAGSHLLSDSTLLVTLMTYIVYSVDEKYATASVNYQNKTFLTASIVSTSDLYNYYVVGDQLLVGSNAKLQ